MTTAQFSKRCAVLIAAGLFALLSDAAAANDDLKPLEDPTKLTKPTICYDGREGLYLIDWDGQNRRFWMKGIFNGPARWSRDGRYASFMYSLNYTHYILDLKTGRLINMTERLNVRGHKDIYMTGAWWFPDGRRLACRTNNYNNPIVAHSDIYVLDIHTTELEQLTATPFKDEYWASVSGDGKEIVFVGYPVLKDEIKIDHGVESPGHPDHLYTMNSDGSNVVNLTNSTAYETYPEWSPDGKKIAFRAVFRPEQAGEVTGADLYMMDPDGSNVERLTNREICRRANLHDWSPDSKWILFHMAEDDDSVSQLHRIHVDTREIVRIGYAGSSTWVWAGKSRFLSVDPAGKKHAQWGTIKEAEAPQETSPEE